MGHGVRVAHRVRLNTSAQVKDVHRVRITFDQSGARAQGQGCTGSGLYRVRVVQGQGCTGSRLYRVRVVQGQVDWGRTFVSVVDGSGCTRYRPLSGEEHMVKMAPSRAALLASVCVRSVTVRSVAPRTRTRMRLAAQQDALVGDHDADDLPPVGAEAELDVPDAAQRVLV